MHVTAKTKTMRTTFALLSLLLIASCNSPVKKSGGPVKTEDRTVSAFTAIEASDAVEIDFSAGAATNVKVEAPANYLPDVVTEVKNGTLFIAVNEVISGMRDPIRVHIQSPELNKLRMSGACSFQLNAPLNKPIFDLHLSGASSFKGTLYNTETVFEMTGASVAEIGGITNQLNIHVSGASSLDAEKLSAVHADVEASGASNTNVSADSTLKAKASGASSISYSGKPLKVDKQSSTGSSVEEK